MKYIESEKYRAINELANKGDEKAKDFLFKFMEMNEKEANEYLASIAISNKSVDSKEINKTLIEDENEAINGYDKAILAETNGKNRKNVIEVYQKIKEEEIKHIQWLKELENGVGK